MDPWLDPAAPRIAMGCMRLSTDADRDEARGLAAIGAALDGGVRILDTARAYGLGEADLGHNERLIARALGAWRAGAPGGPPVAIITKGGMSRAGGMWHPDGRAGALRADAEASAIALGRAPDLWLLHAPDPRTKLATSLRALAAIRGDGLARAVGVSNVNRAQLEEALDAAPIAAVEVAVGAFDDAALRGGVVELCAARGLPLLAHAPLGGPARAAKLARDPVLAALAAARGVSAAQIVLAWLMTLAPTVIPVPGPRRPETARAIAAAAAVVLDDDARATLAARFPSSVMAAPRARRAPSGSPGASPGAPSGSSGDGEVVLIMGIPGAGKTRATAAFTERGYQRLNRDERGGDLRRLAGELDAVLAAGARRVVLDNTYVTRAARADALEAALRHRLPVRGVWLDTAPAQAQVNLCARMIGQLGALPGPDELRASRAPGVMAPTQHMRACRLVEPPSIDEGFASLEVVPFTRAPSPALRPGRVIALDDPAPGDGVATLRLGWRPGARAAASDDTAICPHPGGPPICWCRPPLPGLVVAWALAHGIDLARIEVVAATAAFRTLAAALGGAVPSR